MIDREELDRRVRGDAAIRAEIIGMFLDLGPDLLTTIRRAVDADDRDGLVHGAHKLKGMLATMAAHGTAAVAATLEAAARGDDRGDLRRLVDELVASLDELVPELEALRAASTAP